MDLQDNDLKLNITYSDGIKSFFFNVKLLNITIFKKKIKKNNKLTILISSVFDILCVDRSHYLMIILEINGNLRTPVCIELFNKGSLEASPHPLMVRVTQRQKWPAPIISDLFLIIAGCNHLYHRFHARLVCESRIISRGRRMGGALFFINMLCAIKKYVSSGVRLDPSPSYGTFAT